VEEKRLKQQEVEAKIITQENKLLTTQNELLNAKVELNRIVEYNEKVAKAESDQFTALSNQYDTEAQVNKLKNQYANYSIVTVCITSRLLKMVISIVPTSKEKPSKKEPIATVMPSQYDIAVETFVNPLDLPLIAKGEKIRIYLMGQLSFFSGWICLTELLR
jgi:hypothetical protein